MKVQCHIVKWVEVSDVYEELVASLNGKTIQD